MRFLSVIAGTGLAIATLPQLAAAQVTMVDEGSFVITRNGRPAGREDFSIRTTPLTGGGSMFLAKATASYGDRRLAPVLQADSTGIPVQYSIETRDDATGPAQTLAAKAYPGRFSARMKNAQGESAKEYVLNDGALLLDDDVMHQLWFVTRSTQNPVWAMVPRRGAQVQLRVTTVGQETLLLGGRQLSAKHLRIAESGGIERDLWLDSAGRLLKIVIPSAGLVAVRDEVPR